MTARRTIDLNCDLGEDHASLAAGHDAALAACVTSINIACGGHAGDEHSMRSLVRIALATGTAIGAHPSYPDRTNFGRRAMPMNPDDLERCVREQIATLAAIVANEGARLRHVKPHGALYHAAMRDESIALAIARAVEAIDPSLLLLGMAGAPAHVWWARRGLSTLAEAFADRAYATATMLSPRGTPGSLITDPDLAADQALDMALRDRVNTPSGWASLHADTLCVHADTPGALPIARRVRARLEQHGIVPLAP